jgi:hypothetical protein
MAAGRSRGAAYSGLFKLWFDQGTLEYKALGYGPFAAAMRSSESRKLVKKAIEMLFKAMTSADIALRKELAQRKNRVPDVDVMHVLRGEERYFSLVQQGVWAFATLCLFVWRRQVFVGSLAM